MVRYYWSEGSLSRTTVQVTRLIQTANGDVYYPLLLVAAITVPMQGLPNFLVYLRPRLQKIGRSDPTAGWMKRFARSIARNDNNVSISMVRHRTSFGDIHTTDRINNEHVSVERQNEDRDQESATNEAFEPNREQKTG